MVQEPSYNWEYIEQCPLCDASRLSFFERAWDQGIPIDNLICQACGLVVQSPRMDPESIERYYRAEYILQHQKADHVTRKERGMQAARARHLVEFLSAAGLSVARHLDIGASTGNLMKYISERFDCESAGVEPSDVYREEAQKAGLQVRASLADLQEGMDGRFDLVTMAHVLEHLPNPREYLQTIRSNWLEEDGTILVEVPNLYFHHCFERPHLTSYHSGTLRSILETAGFTDLCISAHGYPRSRRIPLYLLGLAKPAPGLPTSLQYHSNPGLIKIKRRLGRLSYKFAASAVRLVRGKDAMKLDTFYDRVASESDRPIE